MTGPGAIERIVVFGNFELNLHSGELRKAGVKIKLQEQPFKILVALLEHPGQLVTREELRRRIWPSESFGDFDHAINLAVGKLRGALGDSVEVPRLIETLPRRGYRFLVTVEKRPISPGNPPAPPVQEKPTYSRYWWSLAVAGLLVAVVVLGSYWYLHRPPPVLTEKDNIILTDFLNETGDAGFDGSLNRALSVSLSQSPFLSFVSEQEIRQTLITMGRSPEVPLTKGLSQEVCQRVQSKVTLTGTISNVGGQYLITLEAQDCHTGETVVHVGGQASSKEKVLEALGKLSSQLRAKLGESLASIQKFNVPFVQATTNSLEAWKAYNLGIQALNVEGSVSAIPFFRRAIELDPKFADGYMCLAMIYENIGEYTAGMEYAKRSYELRERVTDRERMAIDSLEAAYVEGDVLKDMEILRSWTKTYPRDSDPLEFLSADYVWLGDYERAFEAAQNALSINPKLGFAYGNLVIVYVASGRFEEARKTMDRGTLEGVNPLFFTGGRYTLAFLRNDTNEMKRLAGMAMGQSGYEAFAYSQEADTEAFHGRLRLAREYSRNAVESSQRNGQQEVSAGYVVNAALCEAEFGNITEGRRLATATLRLAPGSRYFRASAALALARTGDNRQAQKIADELRKEYPHDTLLNYRWLPMVYAAIALNQHNPEKALEDLRVASAYELGMPEPELAPMGVIYLRGYGYLAANRGGDAAAEFKKILDNPGLCGSSPVGALARLGLGRAYANAGEKARSKLAYEEFLALWKAADPDILILKQAKAEYANLQ